MSEVSIFSALLGGILTFLAPCTLPLIPGYIAFIGGTGGTGEATGGSTARRRVMANAALFVLGFSVVFIAFGMASGALGKFLVLYKVLIAQVGGAVVIYLGLTLFGLVPLPRFSATGAGRLMGTLSPGSRSGAFLLGFLFALGWSPCLGPILGTILLLAAGGGTLLYGGALLAIYAFGLALPFLLVAYIYGTTFSYVSRLEPYMRFTRIAGGAMLVLVGFLLLIGQFGILNAWAGRLLDGKLFDILLTYT